MANTEVNENAVYQFCQSKWDFYQAQDGGYYPSKHDPKVFNDASKKFDITSAEAKKIFNKIDHEHVAAQQDKIDHMSKPQLAEALKKIVEGNAETPWGAQKVKNKNN